MYFADTLPRAYQSPNMKEPERSEKEKEVESILIHAIEYFAISEPQLNEIKGETAKYSTLQILKHVILKGWPDNKASVPFEVISYFNIREK